MNETEIIFVELLQIAGHPKSSFYCVRQLFSIVNSLSPNYLKSFKRLGTTNSNPSHSFCVSRMSNRYFHVIIGPWASESDSFQAFLILFLSFPLPPTYISIFLPSCLPFLTLPFLTSFSPPDDPNKHSTTAVLARWTMLGRMLVLSPPYRKPWISVTV